MTCDNANDSNDKPFESLVSRYQSGLETSIRQSDSIFDSVHLLYYAWHNTNFTRGGSYIESPDWMKSKKGTVYPKNKNKDDKCFHMQKQLH